ncbi:MAG TPA: helix-turn-helix domain-containing protein [Gemmatimonadaceae bacterium]|nr:helix-turn-helix domain-containing protein [Gemmatimonadaceae bacterium]
MSIVAALVHDPVRFLRLHGALRRSHSVESCPDWAAVARLCEHQPVQLAILDPYTDGELALEPLRQLKRRFPRLTTVVYVGVTPATARDLFDLGRAGIDALIIADQDDEPSTIAAILEQAQARSVASHLRQALAHARPTARDAVLLAVTRAHEPLTAESLAATLLLSRRVLAKHLEQSALPSPQRLITWGRLVIAAHLLEDPHRSADRIALGLRFPSGSAFRNTCQRYLRATPSEIRARGGARFVMDAMLGDAGADALPDSESASAPESADQFESSPEQGVLVATAARRPEADRDDEDDDTLADSSERPAPTDL